MQKRKSTGETKNMVQTALWLPREMHEALKKAGGERGLGEEISAANFRWPLKLMALRQCQVTRRPSSYSIKSGISLVLYHATSRGTRTDSRSMY